MKRIDIFKELNELIQNPIGTIGLMGNLEKESGLNPKNMQNSYESRLGMNDHTYTQAVDNGSYKEFCTDRVGYGYAQWTSSGRKTGLLEFAKWLNTSIGDGAMQIEFVKKELLNGYMNVLNFLRTAKTVEEASDYVCTKYERPADQSETALERRREAARQLYEELAMEDKTLAKKFKVLLDAGHYGKYNRSPGVPLYYESDFAFKFNMMLKEELEEYGVIVILTRTDQSKDLALFARGAMAAGCDAAISTHSNAVGNGVNNSIDYPVAITMVNDDKTDIDERSKELGERLVKVVEEVMGTNQKGRTYTKLSGEDRDGNGIFDDEWYGFLNGVKSVGVQGIILEHSFHTCNRSAEWLLNETNLRKLAKAEAKCIAKHFGVADQAAAVPEETKPDISIWYRVRKSWSDKASQIGAYSVKENALKNCPEGYSVFDENGNAIYTNEKDDTEKDALYRIRKSWADKDSQIGAYRVYDRAVTNCPRGYAVFDGTGKVMFRNVATQEYKVKKGDTLSEIAQKYGTTVKILVAANKARYPKITESFIVTGWKLIVY